MHDKVQKNPYIQLHSLLHCFSEYYDCALLEYLDLFATNNQKIARGGFIHMTAGTIATAN